MAFITLIFIVDDSYFSLMGISFAVLHELGHLLAMHMANIPPQELSFGILNIEISSPLEQNEKNEVFVFLSGPIVNLILGLIFLTAYHFSRNYIIKIALIQNFVLAFINLLPISSLDGGKILSSIISRKLGLDKTEKIMNILSVIFTLPLFTLGFLVMINSKYNLSVLIIACYFISYIFCRETSILK